jgi:thioredoxin 1
MSFFPPLRSTLTSDEEASKTAEETDAPPPPGEIPDFPSMNEHGIYELLNADQHNAWLKANPDKLMVIKFYAPWCRACKSVEPKYIQISKDEKYSDIPIIFGQLSVQHNKAYVKSLGIMALPSMQIYAGSEGLVENFPCGPSKIPILKRKLTDTINAKVDPQTRTLRLDCTNPANSEAEPCRTRTLTVLDETDASEIDEVISDQRKEENLRYLRTGVPYFKDFDDDVFYELMDKVSIPY